MQSLYVIIIIIVLGFLLIIPNLQQYEQFKPTFDNQKPYLWMYWENKPYKTKPLYLELCYKTAIKHCSKSFNFVLLDQHNISTYITDIPDNLAFLSIPQKTDYYRLRLLYQYGGIWLDADTIVMKDLFPLYKLLDTTKTDFIGFGSLEYLHGRIFKGSAYLRPINGVMISKANSDFMKLNIDAAEQIIKPLNQYTNINYHLLGRQLLWNNIDKKTKDGWTYHHVSSTCFDRNSKGERVKNDYYLSQEPLDPCAYSSYLIPVYNTAPGFPQWFLNLNLNQLLNSDMVISQLFRLSLGKQIN